MAFVPYHVANVALQETPLIDPSTVAPTTIPTPAATSSMRRNISSSTTTNAMRLSSVATKKKAGDHEHSAQEESQRVPYGHTELRLTPDLNQHIAFAGNTTASRIPGQNPQSAQRATGEAVRHESASPRSRAAFASVSTVTVRLLSAGTFPSPAMLWAHKCADIVRGLTEHNYGGAKDTSTRSWSRATSPSAAAASVRLWSTCPSLWLASILPQQYYDTVRSC